jgi:hypothetical protein
MGDWEYIYDPLNLLQAGTALAGPYKGQYGCWTYDSFWNRTKEAYSTATSTPCVSGANDNVFSITVTPTAYNQVTGFTYDAAGKVIQDSVNKYVYDPEGRLCADQNILATSASQYV